MLASREFCLIDFEGNDRFGIVAGVEISGADGVKIGSTCGVTSTRATSASRSVAALA